jgi:hypothetical protein
MYEALLLSNQEYLATVHVTELKYSVRLYDYLQTRVRLKLILSWIWGCFQFAKHFRSFSWCCHRRVSEFCSVSSCIVLSSVSRTYVNEVGSHRTSCYELQLIWLKWAVLSAVLVDHWVLLNGRIARTWANRQIMHVTQFSLWL